MDPGNLIIYIILAVLIAFGVWKTVKKIRHGSSCCGEHEAPPAKIRISDTDKKHYPYLYELKVDGMHCSNCARKIENAFNSQSGLWAKAEIGEKKVCLRSKELVGEEILRRIVSDAGYILLSIKLVNIKEDI